MKNKRITILSITIIIVLVIYLSGAYFFNSRFLPGTFINNVKSTGLTTDKVDKKLSETDVWEKIQVTINDEELFVINDKDINYEYFNNSELVDIIDNQNNWLWFTGIFKQNNYEVEAQFPFNNAKTRDIVNEYKPFNNELKNADLVYSEETGQFEITPHSYSMNITQEMIADIIIGEIKSKANKVDLKDHVITPEILDTNENLIKSKDIANESLSVIITYDFGDSKEKVSKEKIKEWIKFNGEEITFDEGLIREYIITLSNKYDTFGKTREFKTTSGKIVNTKGGSYGWLIHRGNTVDDLIKRIKEGKDQTIEPVYSYTAISRKGNDIGNSYVEIDINNQMVYVYSKGELKLSTPTVTGNTSKGHSTPLGVDSITYKATNVVLKGPGYASPVKYWMPFNGGVGLHDADWRSSFGGNIYKTNGSHGCINLPPNIADDVFNLVFSGMPVIVY